MPSSPVTSLLNLLLKASTAVTSIKWNALMHQCIDYIIACRNMLNMYTVMPGTHSPYWYFQQILNFMKIIICDSSKKTNLEPFSQTIFHKNSKVMKSYFTLIQILMIATKICTLNDRCAAVACVKSLQWYRNQWKEFSTKFTFWWKRRQWNESLNHKEILCAKLYCGHCK